MLEPRQNPLLFGHAAAEATFAASLAAGRLHHAWLITGPAGVGKATLAWRLARRLLAPAAPNDPASPAFRRIATGAHADVLTIERELNEKTKKLKTVIAVEQTRAINGFMHRTAAEGGWRVVVVDGADDMNPNAANALLKILEEPSRQGILFLIADAPGRLLPTIRSRCRRLPLAGLAPDEMAAALAQLVPELDAAERSRLGRIADGAPGRAVELAGEGALALSALVDSVLDAVGEASGLPVARMHDVADRAARTESGFATFMTLLQAGLGHAVRDAARAGAAGWGRGRPLAEWGEVWHALGRLQMETTLSNLDQRTTILAGLELLRG